VTVAAVNGVLGVVLAFIVGRAVLELEYLSIVQAILASCLAGMAALLVTLRAERTPWIRRHALNRQSRTWAVFLLIYFGGMVGVAPHLNPLHSPRVFLWMVLPLILCTGFTIIAFGPLQDRIVARIQRRARHHTSA
jgi:hypothetical protein